MKIMTGAEASHAEGQETEDAGRRRKGGRCEEEKKEGDQENYDKERTIATTITTTITTTKGENKKKNKKTLTGRRICKGTVIISISGWEHQSRTQILPPPILPPFILPLSSLSIPTIAVAGK